MKSKNGKNETFPIFNILKSKFSKEMSIKSLQLYFKIYISKINALNIMFEFLTKMKLHQLLLYERIWELSNLFTKNTK